MVANGRVARARAQRALGSRARLRQVARLERGPRDRVCRENVLPIRCGGFGDLQRLGELPPAVGQEHGESRRLGRIGSPGGLGEAVLTIGLASARPSFASRSPENASSAGAGAAASRAVTIASASLVRP